MFKTGHYFIWMQNARSVFTESGVLTQSSHSSTISRAATPHSATATVILSRHGWSLKSRNRCNACFPPPTSSAARASQTRSEEHTSELQSRQYLVCRLLLEK